MYIKEAQQSGRRKWHSKFVVFAKDEFAQGNGQQYDRGRQEIDYTAESLDRDFIIGWSRRSEYPLKPLSMDP